MSSSDSSTDTSTDENKTLPADKPVKQKDTKAEKKQAKPARKGSIFNNFLLMLFILIILAASAGGYYYWQQLNTTLNNLQQTSLSQQDQLSELNSKLNDSSSLIKNQQQTLSALSEKFTTQQNEITSFNKQQQNLIKSTQNIFDITHRNQRQWLLSEVSYLLSLGNQRLIISSDIRTAVAALQAANNRLHDLADPGLLNLRKQIADEITQLNLLKLPDINGMALTIDNMVPVITTLPFKTAKQKTIESSQQSEKIELASIDSESFFAPVWERLKSLVTIKKHSRDIRQSETVIEKADIDQQIRYRLESARLALINKNTAVFNHEISTAINLLKLYYDNSDNRVANIVGQLSHYSDTNLVPELPDITGSWSMLQQIIAVNEANNSLQIENNKEKKGNIIK